MDERCRMLVEQDESFGNTTKLDCGTVADTHSSSSPLWYVLQLHACRNSFQRRIKSYMDHRYPLHHRIELVYTPVILVTIAVSVYFLLLVTLTGAATSSTSILFVVLFTTFFSAAGSFSLSS